MRPPIHGSCAHGTASPERGAAGPVGRDERLGRPDPPCPSKPKTIHLSLLARLTAEAERDGIKQYVVGAVVQHDDKVLLLQRPADDFMSGIFELPSGKVESEETLDAALIREVQEETGLDVWGIQDYLGSFDYLSGSGNKSRQFNFAVDVAAPESVELQEHDAYLWVALTEEPPVTDAVKEVLATYRGLHAP